MPNVKQIIKTMKEQGYSKETLSLFDKSVSIIDFINQMDALLNKEQCYSIMEEQGCFKGGKLAEPFIDFGKRYADKTLEEKVELFKKEMRNPAPCRLNADGTVSVFWEYKDEEGRYRCICRKVKKFDKSKVISLTYCACCGGHIRCHYQLAFGVGLWLKEVVSSALVSGGEKRCELLFEVVE
jgi:hypothetical protein